MIATRASKIRPLAELAAELRQLRGGAGQNPTVVHCHGVFDLLHVGHLRYLQAAKQHGDLLVVTATPDRFVNKGPHRPAFSEDLRAEAIAALECVDYVAINDWPSAVETIALLQPDKYAKGAEYQTVRTPGIKAEERAIKECGGEMVYIEDITSSSSHLLNRYLSPFDEEVVEYLIGLASQHGASGILKYLYNASQLRVAVVGETIIDEYHFGRMMGQSASAPIVAMQYLTEERFAGGAAAIANHLAGLVDEVHLISLTGDLDDEERWLETQLKDNVKPHWVRKSNAPTIIKRRYRESYFAQPMFEVYFMDDSPVRGGDEEELRGEIDEWLPQVDLVIVADYGHGMMSPETARLLYDKSQFLAVNTQTNSGNFGFNTVGKYPRADYVCLAEQEVRLDCRRREPDLHPMLHDIADRLGADRVVVTRGHSGSLAYGRGNVFCEAPALATEIVDRVGAGDAFLSLTSLCAVQNAPLEVLSFCGNIAGAQAVATVGNKDTLDRDKLVRHVESLLK